MYVKVVVSIELSVVVQHISVSVLVRPIELVLVRVRVVVCARAFKRALMCATAIARAVALLIVLAFAR